MTLALLCSGQGTLTPGLFDIFDGEAGAEAIVASATALLGQHPRLLLAAAAREPTNRVSQILSVTQGLAAAAALEPAFPAELLVAGYSVGEMTAWNVAGLWSPAEALRLTARRAEAMDEAGGPDGGLGFVRGLERGAVDALVARFGCAVAIINPGQLTVIGGARTDVERCCAEALRQGAISSRPLAVRVASHTPKLAAAVAPFEEELNSLPAEGRPRPGRKLVSALDGGLIATVRQGSARLAAQLAKPIDWAAVLDALVERGTDRFFELGPGHALTDMVRTAHPGLPCHALADFRSIGGAADWIRRGTA